MAKYNTLKLSLLFAKYLYQNRQLNLPGIGVFTIEGNAAVPDVTDKNFHEFLQYIRFTHKPVAKPDEDFIEFIRSETGKIRPLAESDLESFIGDGKILLNIGKPFHLEGIGSLQKNKSGSYDFFAGEPQIEKLENFVMEKEPVRARAHTFEHEYNPQSKSSNAGRVAWVALAIIIGLGAIIWGGYSLYNRNTNGQGISVTEAPAPLEPATDTITRAQAQPDSVSKRPDTVAQASVTPTYKFIIRETRNIQYAQSRYADLKPGNPSLFMDTKDSITYRLYLTLPATPADTARIKDSLQKWYASRRVLIEQ